MIWEDPPPCFDEIPTYSCFFSFLRCPQLDWQRERSVTYLHYVIVLAAAGACKGYTKPTLTFPTSQKCRSIFYWTAPLKMLQSDNKRRKTFSHDFSSWTNGLPWFCDWAEPSFRLVSPPRERGSCHHFTAPGQSKNNGPRDVMWWEIKLFEDDVCKVRFNLNW